VTTTWLPLLRLKSLQAATDRAEFRDNFEEIDFLGREKLFEKKLSPFFLALFKKLFGKNRLENVPLFVFSNSFFEG
jgi:hypothetical protein